MRMIDYFDKGAKYYPNNVAFIDVDRGDASITYAAASAVTHRIAAAIRGNSYQQGCHISAKRDHRVLDAVGLVSSRGGLVADKSPQHRCYEC